MSLLFRKLQIKTTMKYYSTPVNMTFILKNNTYWRWYGESEFIHSCEKFKWIQPLWKKLWGFLKRTIIKNKYKTENKTKKIELSYIPSVYIKRIEIGPQRGFVLPYHCNTTHNSWDMEAICQSLHEWIKKMWHIYKIKY